MGQVDRLRPLGGSAFSAFSPRRDSEASIVAFSWRYFSTCSPRPGEQPPQRHAGWSLAIIGNSRIISTVTNRNQYDSGRDDEPLLGISQGLVGNWRPQNDPYRAIHAGQCAPRHCRGAKGGPAGDRHPARRHSFDGEDLSTARKGN
jgi:hypothetical protein